MIATILNVVIDGLLIGGIYALIAVGLSLQYGVARVLNVSHGEFIMVGAFLTWMLYTMFDVNPLLCLVIVGPLLFLIAFLLHRTLFRSLLNSSPNLDIFEGRSLLVCFGLLFIFANVAKMIWGGNIASYIYLAFPVHLGGAVFAGNRLVTLGFALAIGLIFYLFLTRTRMGKAIRAAAQDPTTAGLMGVNINQVLALCFGLGAIMAGFAGVLLSMIYPIQTTMGLQYTVIAIIVVVLGGLGSITGSFLGGIILGLIASIATYVEPGLTMVAYYAIFTILLWVRPTGIMGKK